MKLTNHTRYDSRALRAIFLAAVEEVAVVLADGEIHTPHRLRAEYIRNVCHLTIRHNRGSQWREEVRGESVSGHAYYSGRAACVRPNHESTSLDVFLWVVRHEVYHLFGVKHGNMPHAVRYFNESGGAYIREKFAPLFKRYGDTLTERAPAAAEPPPALEDKQAAKLTRIQARLALWESKQARAERAIAKLRKQERYYQGALAARKAER